MYVRSDRQRRGAVGGITPKQQSMTVLSIEIFMLSVNSQSSGQRSVIMQVNGRSVIRSTVSHQINGQSSGQRSVIKSTVSHQVNSQSSGQRSVSGQLSAVVHVMLKYVRLLEQG